MSAQPITALSPEDEFRLIEAVDMIPDSFPGKDFPASSRSLYVRVLSRYPVELVEGAITEAIVAADHGFIPAVGEITARLAERVTGLPGPHAAWLMVQEQVDEQSRPMTQAQMMARAPWDAPDEVKLAVKQIGGFSALRQSTNQVSDRRQFLDAYAALRSKAVNAVKVHGLSALTTPAPQAIPTASALTRIGTGLFAYNPEDHGRTHEPLRRVIPEDWPPDDIDEPGTADRLTAEYLDHATPESALPAALLARTGDD